MKIERNGPCPCGSGKKYKKCCMLNESKDKYLLIRETVSAEGYDDQIADVLCNMVRYIKEKQWMGACHASSAVLYVIFMELGYDVELCVGEVEKPGYKPFDHSWIKLDGKIIDIAVIMTLMGGLPISEAVVLDKDIMTKQKYDIKYGIVTPFGLGEEAHIVMSVPFIDYMDGFPDETNGLWGVIAKVSTVDLDMQYLRNKYKDVKRNFIKVE